MPAAKELRLREHLRSPVRWMTLDQAKATHRPILITRKPEAFSHPLLAEIVDRYFVAVRSSDPSGPSITEIDADGRQIFGNELGDGSVGATANALMTALRATHQPIDPVLPLLAEECGESVRQRATFAMGCFWRGEGELGAIDGVLATEPGMMGSKEVVRVTFNPSIVSYDQLLAKAKLAHVADDVFELPDASFRADTVCTAAAAGAKLAADDGPKYYLQQSPLRSVPMTSVQACRIDGALLHGTSPLVFLSPVQRAMAERGMADPDAERPNEIGVPIERAWLAAVDAIE